MSFKPRHSKVNRRQWLEAKRRFLAAMEDGKVDPHEHRDILDALEGGEAVGAVLEASDALSAAMTRSTDPEYIQGLTATYVAYVERMPEMPPAA